MPSLEQSLDSFPNLGDYDKNTHKIVKKQMTALDYKRPQKNKMPVPSLRGDSLSEDEKKYKKREETEKTMADCGSGDKCRKEKSVFLEPTFENEDSETGKPYLIKVFIKDGPIFRRGLLGRKQKNKKKIAESGGHQMLEKETEAVEKAVGKKKEDEKVLGVGFEKAIGNSSERTIVKAKEKPAENEKVSEPAKEMQDLKKGTDSVNPNNFGLKIQEQSKVLKSMVGCKMNSFCRFPDVQDNHSYFECESDSTGCIKLIHKNCPNNEIFSSRYLECLKPFFWNLVEREKRSLWKKRKKQKYFNNLANGQSSNAWTDVTHEEGKQFPSEFKPQYKPKLVVYHLTVKKAISEPFLKRKERHRDLDTPRLLRAQTSSTLTNKAANIKTTHHQIFPRSFIIRVNKKDGENDQEKSTSEDDKDDMEDEGDEEDDEEDDEIGEEPTDDDESANDDAEDKKNMEKGGIKEFFKSAKEAITNKARFSEPADTSFTLDKTNPISKNKKLNVSEKNSKKILIDADIKVDKSLGKTLKRILGKRKDPDDGNACLSGNPLRHRRNRDGGESEEITEYESLIRSNPRLKRYFLGTLGEREN